MVKRNVKVRSHYRRIDGKRVRVKTHVRSIEGVGSRNVRRIIAMGLPMHEQRMEDIIDKMYSQVKDKMTKKYMIDVLCSTEIQTDGKTAEVLVRRVNYKGEEIELVAKMEIGKTPMKIFGDKLPSNVMDVMYMIQPYEPEVVSEFLKKVKREYVFFGSIGDL